jgi:hypothetical protein
MTNLAHMHYTYAACHVHIQHVTNARSTHHALSDTHALYIYIYSLSFIHTACRERTGHALCRKQCPRAHEIAHHGRAHHAVPPCEVDQRLFAAYVRVRARTRARGGGILLACALIGRHRVRSARTRGGDHVVLFARRGLVVGTRQPPDAVVLRTGRRVRRKGKVEGRGGGVHPRDAPTHSAAQRRHGREHGTAPQQHTGARLLLEPSLLQRPPRRTMPDAGSPRRRVRGGQAGGLAGDTGQQQRTCRSEIQMPS